MGPELVLGMWMGNGQLLEFRPRICSGESARPNRLWGQLLGVSEKEVEGVKLGHAREHEYVWNGWANDSATLSVNVEAAEARPIFIVHLLQGRAFGGNTKRLKREM